MVSHPDRGGDVEDIQACAVKRGGFCWRRDNDDRPAPRCGRGDIARGTGHFLKVKRDADLARTIPDAPRRDECLRGVRECDRIAAGVRFRGAAVLNAMEAVRFPERPELQAAARRSVAVSDAAESTAAMAIEAVSKWWKLYEEHRAEMERMFEVREPESEA